MEFNRIKKNRCRSTPKENKKRVEEKLSMKSVQIVSAICKKSNTKTTLPLKNAL